MAVTKLVFHYSEFNAFRSQPEIQAELNRRAEAIREATGAPDEFVAEASPNRTRARAVVVTATEKGKALEATDRALTHALSAGQS